LQKNKLGHFFSTSRKWEYNKSFSEMNSTSVSIDVANQKESAKTSLIRNPYFFNDEAENTDCPISPKLKPN
jgi:hypothetical protein